MLNPTWPGPSAKVSPRTEESPQQENRTGIHPANGSRVTELPPGSPERQELEVHKENPDRFRDMVRFVRLSNASSDQLEFRAKYLLKQAPLRHSNAPSSDTVSVEANLASPSTPSRSEEALVETGRPKASGATHQPQKAETITSSIRPAPMPKPKKDVRASGPSPTPPSPSPSPAPQGLGIRDVHSHLQNLGDFNSTIAGELKLWYADHAKSLVAKSNPASFYSPMARAFFSRQNFLPSFPTTLIGNIMPSYILLNPHLRRLDPEAFAAAIDEAILTSLQNFAQKYHEIGLSMSALGIRLEPSRMQAFMDQVIERVGQNTHIPELVKQTALRLGVPMFALDLD